MYVGLWGLMAMAALGYLMALSFRPDAIASLFRGDPEHLAQQRNDGRHSITSLVTELTRTRSAVARIEQDLADTRATLVDRDRRVAALEAKLSAAEARIDAGHDQAQPPQSAAAPGHTGGNSRDQNTSKGSDKRDTVAEATKSTWETSSIKPTQPKAKEQAPVSGRSFGLGLGTGPSLDALRLSWQLLQDRHPGELSGLQPRYIRSERRPFTYRLVVGPVHSSEQARKVCDSIKLPKAGCSILTYSGKPL
ncbi:MAG: SPOR domain-containing protein [Hyphomicrobiaceae bacterium]